MDSFLFAVAGFVVADVAVGLFRIFLGRRAVDCAMAAQLISSGGVAALLLVAVATRTPAIVDVALMLALLAAFASAAFVRDASGPQTQQPEADGR